MFFFTMIKINENNIKFMVNEVINRLLTESVSRVVYHFTSIKTLIDILRRDEFFLTMATNKSDSIDKKRLFYLSTQRTRSSQIGYGYNSRHSNVRIELDGDALNQRYAGKSYDYWYMGTGQGERAKNDYHRSSFEFEDRILSNDPVIPNARKYIKRVDILLNGRFENEVELASMALYMLREKVFVYDNIRDFNAQTDNTVNDKIANEYQNGMVPLSKNVLNGLKKKRNIQTLHYLCSLYVRKMTKSRYELKDKSSLVVDILAKFDLKAYCGDVITRIWANEVFSNYCMAEFAHLLINTSGYSPRKLNHEQMSDEANNVMRFAAYVLKIYGCSSFNELASKFQNNEIK